MRRPGRRVPDLGVQEALDFGGGPGEAHVQRRRPADTACEAAGGLVSEKDFVDGVRAALARVDRGGFQCGQEGASSRAGTSFSLLPSTGHMLPGALTASAYRRGSVWGRLWRQEWQTQRVEELSFMPQCAAQGKSMRYAQVPRAPTNGRT